MEQQQQQREDMGCVAKSGRRVVLKREAALNFSEDVLLEWTDGELVLQHLQNYCNGDEQEQSHRIFLYKEGKPKVTKSMRWITGWNGGPKGGNRHWSAEELDSVMQAWLLSIPESEEDDRHMIRALSILVKSTLHSGSSFDDDNLHYLIFMRLSELIKYYMALNKPLEKEESCSSEEMLETFSVEIK